MALAQGAGKEIADFMLGNVAWRLVEKLTARLSQPTTLTVPPGGCKRIKNQSETVLYDLDKEDIDESNTAFCRTRFHSFLSVFKGSLSRFQVNISLSQTTANVPPR